MDRVSVSSADLEAVALVALWRSRKRPAELYADLVEEIGSAHPILEEERGLLAPQLLDAAARQVAQWAGQGFRLVTLLDPEYPANLHAVHDRPPLLFVQGRIEACDRRSVAVIGSRRASPAGLARASAIAEELVASGYTIASGLAAGIDTTAHVAALARGGRTIAVVGTGLRHAYPPRNASLQRRIAAKGAVISQFWPDTPASRRNFPQRNAVMSGIALATVVVEATRTSGARTQVRAALAHGRPVLVAGELLDEQWARDLAARPGVYAIRSLPEFGDVIARLTSTDGLVA
jgi:DNA processing protein